MSFELISVTKNQQTNTIILQNLSFTENILALKNNAINFKTFLMGISYT